MFLTIVTRCCKRPRMLTSNIESVLSQTDRDIEQIFIVDRNQAGIRRANISLAQNKNRISGDYVYILDDDTRLEDKNFVAKIRRIARTGPGVIMVKSRRPQFAPHILPKPFVWNCPERLALTSTNCLCYIVKRQVWLEYIEAFGESAAGDWHFLKAVRDSGASFVWLNEIVAETQQLGRGRLFEKCDQDWFQQVAQKFELTEVAPSDWRLSRHAKPRPKKKKVKEAESRAVAKQPQPRVDKPVPVPVSRRVPRSEYHPRVTVVTRVPEPVLPVPAHSLLGRRRKGI